MGHVALTFGIVALGVCGLNMVFARRDADAICLSLMLLGMWAVSNLLVGLGPRPDSMGAYPLIDLIGGLAAWLAWRSDRAGWKRLLVWAFLAVLGVHVAFWTWYRALPTWWPDMGLAMGVDMSPEGRKQTRNLYVLGLNVSFAVQLACAAWPGGSNAVVVFVGGLLERARRRNQMGALS